MLVTVFVSPKEALFFQEKVLLVARPLLTVFIPRVVSLYRHESPRGHQSWEPRPAVPWRLPSAHWPVGAVSHTHSRGALGVVPGRG